MCFIFFQNKSKLDWDQFKKDNKLEDDLQIHNKGKQGYVCNLW